MFYIKQIEPEGWLRAYVVFFAGNLVATFRYADSAQAYIEDHFA